MRKNVTAAMYSILAMVPAMPEGEKSMGVPELKDGQNLPLPPGWNRVN